MKPVKYILTPDIYVENRDPEDRFKDKPTWAIVKHGSCFNRDGEWEWEPSPSNRDDEFLRRCRFTWDEVQVVAQKLRDDLASKISFT